MAKKRYGKNRPIKLKTAEKFVRYVLENTHDAVLDENTFVTGTQLAQAGFRDEVVIAFDHLARTFPNLLCRNNNLGFVLAELSKTETGARIVIDFLDDAIGNHAHTLAANKSLGQIFISLAENGNHEEAAQLFFELAVEANTELANNEDIGLIIKSFCEHEEPKMAFNCFYVIFKFNEETLQQNDSFSPAIDALKEAKDSGLLGKSATKIVKDLVLKLGLEVNSEIPTQGTERSR